MKRAYPYTAWVLLPSFAPKEVTLIEQAYSFSHPEWDKSESGKSYHAEHELFATKQAAIDAGWKRIATQEAKLTKEAEGIKKRRAALLKAEGK